jgi:hypothetical protein
VRTFISPLWQLALVLGVQTQCFAAGADSSPTIWQTWLASLQAQGYGVTQGTANEYTVPYCQQNIYPVFKTCFDNDPGDPYLQPWPPEGNGYIDPYFQNTSTLPNGTVVGPYYRLGTTEAMLVVVTLPPMAAYFAYETYLFTRPTSLYPNGYQMISPDPSRAMLFASFNNSINNVAIAQQSGLSFGSGTVAFITTGNASMATNLINSFSAVGGDTALLFPEALGSNLNLGLDAGSDDFTTVVRYSVSEHDFAGNYYRTHVATAFQVYRIDQPAGLPITPYGATPLRNKAFNTDESGHASTLAELSQLLRNWLATEENDSAVAIRNVLPSEKVTTAGALVSGHVGPYCIAQGTNCSGDDQDADYWWISVGTLAANQMFMVDGVNHAVTNDTTFMSVAAIDAPTATGIASSAQTNPSAAGFDSGALTGSAAEVLQDLGLTGQASPGLINDLPNLFVHIFTRPCVTPMKYCLKPYTTTLTTDAIPYTDVVNMTERAYLLPGYLNGANTDYLINPNLIY